MKSLEDFVSKNEPQRRTSKLKELENEIVQLYQNGYRVEQILEFLKNNKIKTSKRNLYKFLQKHKNDHGVATKTTAANGGEVKKKAQKEEGIDTDKWLEDVINKHTK